MSERRSLSRESITASTEELTIQVHRTDGSPPIFAGFRQVWMESEDETGGEYYAVSCGAGFGSPYITIEVERANGTKVHEFIDFSEFVRSRIKAVLEETN